MGIFKPKMDYDFFHTTALINGIFQLCALFDPGSSAFATISQNNVNRLYLKTCPLTPRLTNKVLNNISGVITQGASMTLDIGGLKIENAWAYVVPKLNELIILATSWMKHCHAELDSVNSKLTFKSHHSILISNEFREKLALRSKPNLCINQVMSSTFTGLAHRAKKNRQIQIFATFLAAIEKAPRPKTQISLEEIRDMLPPSYRSCATVFNPKEAATLPPNRPGIDHKIP